MNNLLNFSHFLEGCHNFKVSTHGIEQYIPGTNYTNYYALKFFKEKPKDTAFTLTVAYYPPTAVG